MAKRTLDDVRLHFRGYNVSGYTNQVDFNADAATPECTTFASAGWREYKGGLKTGAVNFSGFWDAAQPDASLWAADGENPVVVTLDNPASIGDVAYFLSATRTNYEQGAVVGELAGFSVQFRGDSPMVRGVILGDADADTVGGNLSGHQHGAAVAGQTIYAVLQMPSIDDATSVDVTIESDDNAGFTTATTRFTFTQVTAAGAYEIMTLAGPVTDDYWRATVTINGGTTPAIAYNIFLGFHG